MKDLEFRDLVYANSLFSTKMSERFLNRPRIHAMIRARSYEAAAKILEECAYTCVTGAVDEIIEAAAHEALETFVKHCPDENASECARLIYTFKHTKHADLKRAEEELLVSLKSASEKIRDARVRAHFGLYVAALEGDTKINDNTIWNSIREMRADGESYHLVFCWFAMKEFEMRAVRCILLCKIHGVEADRVVGMLGANYERFN